MVMYINKCYSLAVDDLRQSFMMDTLDTHHGMPRCICRKNIYEDVMATYQENAVEILSEFPFRIRYEGEQAVDTGGVSRDMFSAFWDKAYVMVRPC